MRKVTLTKDEAGILHTSINQGNPQQGLSLQEIRDAIPLMDKMEAHGKEVDGGPQVGMVWVFEKGFDLELKESEYTLAKTKLDNSNSWINVSAGRMVVALADKLAELPSEEQSEPEKDVVEK